MKVKRMDMSNEPLRVLMARANMKPGQLARAAGVSESLVHKVLAGGSISREYAIKICNALGVALSEVTEFEKY